MGAPLHKMSAADFLEWERRQEGRHEFVDGHVFAMSGASRAHVRTTFNIVQELNRLLRGRPCEALGIDMKLAITKLERYFYPDVLVTCSERDRQDTDVMHEPTIVFEVLSPSTESYDRGDKFWAYRHLPTLQEYVLVDPIKRRIEVYRRVLGQQNWAFQPLETGQPIPLESLSISVAWATVFEGVDEAAA